MKISISIVETINPKIPFVLQGDFKESIEYAKKIGYDAVELHIQDPKKVDVEKLKNNCLNNGIEVSSIGTGLSFANENLSLMSSDKFIRKAAIQRVKDFIEFAKVFDAVVIIGLMKGIVGNEDYLKCEKRVFESLTECLQLAESNKVKLVVEAINRYESDFLNTISSTKKFISKFNSKYIEVMIDTFHMNIEESKLDKSILDCGNKIGHVHFADNNRMYPGSGHIDFESVLNALNEIEYKGFIAIECLSLPTSYYAAQNSIEYLSQFIK